MSRGRSAATIALIERARVILDEIAPCSVRAVCYRLFVAGVIPNMSKNSTANVSRILVEARERGEINWSMIVDETRKVAKTPSWRDPRELFEVAAHQYRRNRWSEQPLRLEVWSEKGTVRGTLAPVLIRYGVPFRVMHGFASATVANDIAQLSIGEDKPFAALYVGDRDPSGMWMSEMDLPGRISRYGGKVDIARIAIAEADTESRDVPSFNVDTKTGDARHDWFVKHYGTRCWELDALSPAILRERVEREIIEYIDQELWTRADEIEAVERASLNAYIAGMPGNFRQVANCSDPKARP
jgi:hypothetical protein